MRPHPVGDQQTEAPTGDDAVRGVATFEVGVEFKNLAGPSEIEHPPFASSESRDPAPLEAATAREDDTALTSSGGPSTPMRPNLPSTSRPEARTPDTESCDPALNPDLRLPKPNATLPGIQAAASVVPHQPATDSLTEAPPEGRPQGRPARARVLESAPAVPHDEVMSRGLVTRLRLEADALRLERDRSWRREAGQTQIIGGLREQIRELHAGNVRHSPTSVGFADATLSSAYDETLAEMNAALRRQVAVLHDELRAHERAEAVLLGELRTREIAATSALLSAAALVDTARPEVMEQRAMEMAACAVQVDLVPDAEARHTQIVTHAAEGKQTQKMEVEPLAQADAASAAQADEVAGAGVGVATGTASASVPVVTMRREELTAAVLAVFAQQAEKAETAEKVLQAERVAAQKTNEPTAASPPPAASTAPRAVSSTSGAHEQAAAVAEAIVQLSLLDLGRLHIAPPTPTRGSDGDGGDGDGDGDDGGPAVACTLNRSESFAADFVGFTELEVSGDVPPDHDVPDVSASLPRLAAPYGPLPGGASLTRGLRRPNSFEKLLPRAFALSPLNLVGT